jgi:hypothetical protein
MIPSDQTDLSLSYVMQFESFFALKVELRLIQLDGIVNLTETKV